MIIASLSGGKDSVAMLLYLVEHYGPGHVIAHLQVLPEDWPETVPYTQDLCGRLDVQLVAQQIIYEHVGDGTGVRTWAIIDITDPLHIVPWGQDGVIAGITDLAMRRHWPSSPATRYCTTYFKVRVLNRWIIDQQRTMALGKDVVVALGERWAESPRRAKKVEWWPRAKCQRRAYNVWNWLPVISWSRRRVFRILRDHSIEPHPAYHHQGMADWQMYDQDTEGGPRTSCRFCIYATKSDICHQMQIETNKPLTKRIERIERITGRTWWMGGRSVASHITCYEQGILL